LKDEVFFYILFLNISISFVKRFHRTAFFVKKRAPHRQDFVPAEDKVLADDYVVRIHVRKAVWCGST
jgi:hypothetical protein